MVHFSSMPGKIELHPVRDLLFAAAKRLRPKRVRCVNDVDEGWLDAEVLMAYALKKDRSWIIAHGNDCLSPYLESCFLKLVDRREKREPVAYIIGQKDFYGRTFAVTPSVLIPRPETELFIDTLKKRFKQNDRFLLWDLGTGSGAIAVTVAKEFPRSQIIASDISAQAISVAKKNASRHRVNKRITFIKADLLEKKIIRAIERVGNRQKMGSKPNYELRTTNYELVIAANLPYLPDRDHKKLDVDVVAYEPEQALFSGKDGLDAIRRLFDQIDDELNALPKLLLCEFDPPQSKTLQTLAKKMFPTLKIYVIKDLAGRERLLEISQ